MKASVSLRMSTILLAGISTLISGWQVSTTVGQDLFDGLVQVDYRGKHYAGQPLAWDGKEMLLLRRDGRMSMFPITSAEEVSVLQPEFEPYSFGSMERQLRREFGSKYQVSRTQNFLVVHPPGDAQRWATPFQDLYHQFDLYFSSQRIKLNQPDFPMVAVVLRTRKEFDRFLVNYHDYDPQLLGYYSMTSNRIITYDPAEGTRSDVPLLQGNRTLVHEATHQTAFNRGLHSRFAPQIRWNTEGLAMMFEAPGVHNSVQFRRLEDRINGPRLVQLKRYLKQDAGGEVLPQLVVSDDLFRTAPDQAYAYAWGLTFFLRETMPQQYRDFLKRDSERQAFQKYGSANRATDFAASFGSNLGALEGRMKRYILNLPVPAASR